MAAVFADAAAVDTPDGPPSVSVGELRFWQHLSGRQGFSTWLAAVGTEPGGACWAVVRGDGDSRNATVRLAVRPDQRRHGLGSQLLAEAMGWAAARAVKSVVVMAPDERTAQRFADTVGARIVGKLNQTAAPLASTQLSLDERNLARLGFDVSTWQMEPPPELQAGYYHIMAQELVTSESVLVPAIDDAARHDGNVLSALVHSRQQRIVTCVFHRESKEVVAVASVVVWEGTRVQQNGSFVSASHRGRGLGSAAMVACLSFCRREFPAATVYGWAAESNGKIAELVRGLGLEPAGTVVIYDVPYSSYANWLQPNLDRQKAGYE